MTGFLSPNFRLLAAASTVSLLTGGSIFAMLMYELYMKHSTPSHLLDLIRPPLQGGFIFFVIFNTLLEVVFYPLLLLVRGHWSDTKQVSTWILRGAALFYLGRAWTYLHFVPKVMGYMKLTHGDLSDAVIAEIHLWIRLSWLRTALDFFTMVCLLSAISCVMTRKGRTDKNKSE